MKQLFILVLLLVVTGCLGTEQASNPVYDRDARICKANAARAVPMSFKNPGEIVFIQARRNDIADGCMAQKGW